MTSDPGGLVHLGLLYDDAEHLASTLLPRIRAAVRAGEDVHLMTDRASARVLREGLGADADGVAFPSAVEVFGREGFLRRLRSWARPDRRTLVVGQYATTTAAGGDCAFAEDGINLVCADLPITIVCTCRADADPGLVRTARRAHAEMADGTPGGLEAPATSSPVPSELWGDAALRVHIADTADLRSARTRVARLAEEQGLRGDDADAAVLAVHEAALLLCRTSATGCVLEVRASGRALLSEVLSPGPHVTLDAEPLRHLRLFCRSATLDEAPDRRTVRVLTATEG